MEKDIVIQLAGTVYEEGYGMIAQKVMRDTRLHRNARLIYSYLCSFAGSSLEDRTAYPSAKLIQAELGMGEDTFYKYRKQLIEYGYITVQKQRQEGKFDRNLYYINAVPEVKEKTPHPKNKGTVTPHPNLSGTVKPSTEKPSTVNKGTKSISIKSNSIKSNSIKKDEEDIIISAEKNSDEIQLEILEDFLKEKNVSENDISETLEEFKRHNIDFTYKNLETQFEYMVNSSKPIWNFSSFFVGGLKKLESTNKLREQHEKEEQIKRANRDKSVYYDWLAE